MAQTTSSKQGRLGASELDELATEAGGDAGAGYETLSTHELVELMNETDAGVAKAVGEKAAAIAGLVDAISARMQRGGRLLYVGAGSSGRIAALDASECESTFSMPEGTVVALVAGARAATVPEQEAAEDDFAGGMRELAELDVGPEDSVVGVSASGRTPYVLGALTAAGRAGALTAGVVCVEGSEVSALVDHDIAVVVGPEFLAGSTRLKAGTAQKLVLNAISTVTMIRLGKTYGNLMVEVAATNEKLRARVHRIVRTATGSPPDRVDEALAAAGGDAKVAIVSLLTSLDADAARARLAGSGGSVHGALGG